MIRWGHFWAKLAEWARRNGLEAEDLSPMEAALARDLARGELRNSGAIYVAPPLFTQRQPDEVQ